MKVAILAGGRGARLEEETRRVPKPLVEVGGLPILCHVMNRYERYGYREFVIALGYKGACIRDWFGARGRGVEDPFPDGTMAGVHRFRNDARARTVDLVETGAATATGGRIKALGPALGSGTFMLTWADGVSNIDLDALLAFHRAHGKLATLTAVRPPPRFGHLTLDGAEVIEFAEKPEAAEGWINGAFFVLEPGVLDYIDGPRTQFEAGPLQRLAADGELMAYRHHGFWQCMDTLHDRHVLERLWRDKTAPWLE